MWQHAPYIVHTGEARSSPSLVGCSRSVQASLLLFPQASESFRLLPQRRHNGDSEARTLKSHVTLFKQLRVAVVFWRQVCSSFRLLLQLRQSGAGSFGWLTRGVLCLGVRLRRHVSCWLAKTSQCILIRTQIVTVIISHGKTHAPFTLQEACTP